MGLVRSMLEEERFKLERLEEQMNDMGELSQNEVTNLKQVHLAIKMRNFKQVGLKVSVN